jgi:hypothetical protein
MPETFRSTRQLPSETIKRPNVSTENQPAGSARRPSATLDREPARDPESGGSIPDNYDPQSMTRKGEASETRAGREGAGPETPEVKGG